MAGKKKNGTAESKPKEAEAVGAVSDEDDEAYEDISEPEIDGYWHVRKGGVIKGTVVGRMQQNGIRPGDPKRDVVMIEVSEPCEHVQKGDKADDFVEKSAPMAAPGSVVGVNCRHRLIKLLFCVRHRCKVKVEAVEKKPIGGGKTMWQFKIGVIGKRDVPPPLEDLSMLTQVDSEGYEDGSAPL